MVPQGHVSRSKNTRSKRRQVIKAIGAGAFAGTAGCLGGSSSQEFHFLTDMSGSEEKTRFRNAFEAYTEQRDDASIETKLEFVDISGFNSKINTYLSSGNAPDLLAAGTDMLVYKNQLADLSDLASEFDVPESMALEFEGSVPLMPFVFELNGNWYRKDIYDEAGVSPPRTWAENDDAMAAVDEALPDDQYPMSYTIPDEPGIVLNSFGAQEKMLGISYIERTGPNLDDIEVSLGKNRDTMVKALEYFKEHYQKYSPDSTSWGWSDLTQVFVNGKVMTATYPGRLLNNVEAQNPDLSSVTKPTTYPVPTGKSYPEDYSPPVVLNGFSAPKDGDTDLARDFLSWFYDSEYYVDAILALPLHHIPVDLDLLDTQPFKENDMWAKHSGYKEYIRDHLERGYVYTVGRTEPATPYWDQVVYDSGIASSMWQEVLLDRKEPRTAVNETEQKLKEKLPEVVEQYS